MIPQPTTHHARLRRLAGTWKGRETIFPMAWAPEGATAEGVMSCRMACGDLFLVMDYTQVKNGMPGFEGHGVYGWDPPSGKYAMNWVDSMTGHAGAITPVFGTWEGNVLAFDNESDEQRVRYVYEWSGDDELTFRIESLGENGEWKRFMEGRYRRER